MRAFERIHTDEFAKARSIYIRSSDDENKVYAVIKPIQRKLILQDMDDIAVSNKISLKDACTLFVDNADALAKEMHFSKVQFDVYKALTKAQ